MKRALPALAVLLLIACALQVTLRGLSAPPPEAPGDSAQAKMLNPRFAGKSRDGRSFVVTGREGMADAKDAHLILIDQPVLKLSTPRRKLTTMTSQTGVYNEADHKLLLKGDVRVDDGGGARFTSEQAVVDTRTGAVTGQTGLKAQGQAGQLQARDYTVMDEGDRMIFKGGVRGRITPQK